MSKSRSTNDVGSRSGINLQRCIIGDILLRNRKETGHGNEGNKEGRVRDGAISLFYTLRREVVPLVRSGELGRFKLHEARPMHYEPNLC